MIARNTISYKNVFNNNGGLIQQKKAITFIIKTHTITKIKTDNETKKERGKSSGRKEREREERENNFFLSVAHELISFSIWP